MRFRELLGIKMRTLVRNPRMAVIIALVLCLPIVIILSLIASGVEPEIIRQDRVLNGGLSRLGSVVSLGATLLLPLASLICLLPIVRRGGTFRTIAPSTPNFLLAIAILLLFLSIIGAIVIDQWPCWAGVPNCD